MNARRVSLQPTVLVLAAAAATVLLLTGNTASAFSVTPGGPSAFFLTPTATLWQPTAAAFKLNALHMARDTFHKDPASSSTALQASTVADEETTTTTTTTTTLPAKSWMDDDFVFGLEGSGLERPKGRGVNVVVEGDTLETQTYQVVAVTATFCAHAAFAASAVNSLWHGNHDDAVVTAAQVLATTVASWAAADLGSGVLHWSVDNYGNGRTPVMGGIIAAFQGHHSAPWTITQRAFCNNVYKLCVPFGVLPVAAAAAFTNPLFTYFLVNFCALEIGSQEFHKWAHQLPSECPAWVNWLQKTGITIGRKTHAQHHLAPYAGNYCIVSGFCNEALDQSGFFRRLEHAVYQSNGVEPNAWKLDAALKERTLRGDYPLPRRVRAAASKK
jgi:ubiquitin-conjugating enzyme E2 variant